MEEMLLNNEGYVLVKRVALFLKENFGEETRVVVKRVELEKVIGKKLDSATVSSLIQTFKMFGVEITSEIISPHNKLYFTVTTKPDIKKLLKLQKLQKKRNATPIIIA